MPTPPSPQNPPSPNAAAPSHHLFPAGHLLPFILVTALFFLWGIPNNLNDVLIRHFMKSFAISRFQAGLVQSAFYMGYFLLAIPAALMMKRAGYKAGFVVGLLLFASGAFLFWPAAITGSYGFFLFALFVIASGLSFLETASNPFIAQLGDPDSSERRLNFSQAFNPLGAITGALIGTVFIFSGVELSPATNRRHSRPNIPTTLTATRNLARHSSLSRHRRSRRHLGRCSSSAQSFPSSPANAKPDAAHRGSFRQLFRQPPFRSRRHRAIPLRRRASRHLELLHLICSGIRPPARKNRRLFPHRHARRFRRGPLHRLPT